MNNYNWNPSNYILYSLALFCTFAVLLNLIKINIKDTDFIDPETFFEIPNLENSRREVCCHRK